MGARSRKPLTFLLKEFPCRIECFSCRGNCYTTAHARAQGTMEGTHMRRREDRGLGQLGQLTFVGPQKPRPERAAPNSSPDSDAFPFQKAIKLGTVGLKVLCSLHRRDRWSCSRHGMQGSERVSACQTESQERKGPIYC